MLPDIGKKIENNGRLDFEDGVRLFKSPDILALGELASRAREKLHGKKTYYSRNLHVNYTNVCSARCSFCDFSRSAGEEEAYAFSVPEILKRVQQAFDQFEINEVHIVGGLNPELRFEYYIDLVRGIRNLSEGIFIKAFTACEIEFIAARAEKPVREVLSLLREAGLNGLPGGGAEILNDGIRQTIGARKASSEEWLNVHRMAHRMGLVSNCTMLYGHIETAENLVEHLLKLRALQDETGGFRALVPLPYTKLAKNQSPVTSHQLQNDSNFGYGDLKVFAVARLMLDNIPHIKAHSAAYGVKLAQVTLAFGADDFGGLNLNEKIFAESLGKNASSVSEKKLLFYITSGGYEPVLTDSSYRSHKVTSHTSPV